jgi:hypothetical protein
LTGAKGSYAAAEDVDRVTFARTDVKVTVEERALHPCSGLTSWAAVTPGAHGGGLMAMGDLVLFEDELNPVMSAALDNGLEVNALHNHFFYESSRVMFMHIGGSGSAEKLAAARCGRLSMGRCGDSRRELDHRRRDRRDSGCQGASEFGCIQGHHWTSRCTRRRWSTETLRCWRVAISVEVVAESGYPDCRDSQSHDSRGAPVYLSALLGQRISRDLGEGLARGVGHATPVTRSLDVD